MLRSTATEWHLMQPFVPKTLAPARALGAGSAEISCEIAGRSGQASRTMIAQAVAAILTSHGGLRESGLVMVPDSTTLSIVHMVH